MGKEQLPLYIVMYGVFIILFRFKNRFPITKNCSKLDVLKKLLDEKNIQHGISMILIGLVWFSIAFFVVIPSFAHYRIEGFQKFAETIELDTTIVRDVQSPNYFISRYEAFGDSYVDVFLGMLTHPKELIRIMFDGDKLENLRQTLEPLAYSSLLSPGIFAILVPDFLINYATSAGGIGTAEIINHRISMLIPVLFISSIYGVSTLSGWAESIITKGKFSKSKISKASFAVFFAVVILGSNVKTSFDYQNPVYLWLTQAIQKRVSVFAKEDLEIGAKEDIEVGDVVKLTALDNKDRECATKIVNTIPDNASVSGPDYLGAHLSMRETYAIFPRFIIKQIM